MALILWKMAFAGYCPWDQPLYIEAKFVENDRYDKRKKYNTFKSVISLSKTQLINPETIADYYNKGFDFFEAYNIHTKKTPEHVAAKELADWLFAIYTSFRITNINWVGDFMHTQLHQIRAFLMRHGLNPFMGSQNTTYIDSTFAGSSSNTMNLMEEVVSEKGARSWSVDAADGWFRMRCKSRKPFIAIVGISRRERNQIDLYIPVSSNTKGAVLFKANSFYEALQKDQSVDPMEFFTWTNFYSTQACRIEDANIDVQEVLKAVKGHEIYEFLKDNSSPEKLFDYWDHVNKEITDPEINIYRYGTRNEDSLMLMSAIYYGQSDELLNKGKKHLTLMYIRHLMRVHPWSTGNLYDSNEEEDLDVKECLLSHGQFRYLKRQPAIVPYGTENHTLDDITKFFNNNRNLGWVENAERMVFNSDMHNILMMDVGDKDAPDVGKQ